jgi:membrane protein YdbS with pleckstrin-like domain
MKPFFVSMKDGQRRVHWPKLVAFAVVVLVLAAGAGEGLWFLLTQTLSASALVVALVVGTLIVVRAFVRAISYQEEELEMTIGSS